MWWQNTQRRSIRQYCHKHYAWMKFFYVSTTTQTAEVPLACWIECNPQNYNYEEFKKPLIRKWYLDTSPFPVMSVENYTFDRMTRAYTLPFCSQYMKPFQIYENIGTFCKFSKCHNLSLSNRENQKLVSENLNQTLNRPALKWNHMSPLPLYYCPCVTVTCFVQRLRGNAAILHQPASSKGKRYIRNK